MGLNQKIEELEKAIKQQEEEKVKPKKWKFPFGKKVSKGQSKKGYVNVFKINENGNVEILKERIDDQTIIVDGIPRLTTADQIFQIGKTPVVILPSWSVKPLSRPALYEESLIDGTNVKGFRILMAKMQEASVDKKKGMPKVLFWIIGIIIACVIGYVIFTGGV